jgi:hypothetical protein
MDKLLKCTIIEMILEIPIEYLSKIIDSLIKIIFDVQNIVFALFIAFVLIVSAFVALILNNALTYCVVQLIQSGSLHITPETNIEAGKILLLIFSMILSICFVFYISINIILIIDKYYEYAKNRCIERYNKLTR